MSKPASNAHTEPVKGEVALAASPRPRAITVAPRGAPMERGYRVSPRGVRGRPTSPYPPCPCGTSGGISPRGVDPSARSKRARRARQGEARACSTTPVGCDFLVCRRPPWAAEPGGGGVLAEHRTTSRSGRPAGHARDRGGTGRRRGTRSRSRRRPAHAPRPRRPATRTPRTERNRRPARFPRASAFPPGRTRW